MNFLRIPERLNKILYKRSIFQLRKKDLELAEKWTLDFIRDQHPHWSEKQVKRHFDNLLKIKVIAVDDWSKKFGLDRSN